MLNVLVKGGTEDGFVLFRAIEPRLGIEQMQARRRQMAVENLCSGPGKLAQALGVTGLDHGRDLCAGEEVGFRGNPGRVAVEADVRVGISRAAHLPWRFLLKESRFVSVRPGTSPRKLGGKK
jgi:DNA-3-methyladenine glycosylase